MLDAEKGGHFKLAPILNEAKHKQLYLPDTNMLLTRFLADEGVAEISDFMPVAELGHSHQIIRRAKTVRGKIDFRIVCAPAFDYGRASRRIEKDGSEIIFISEGKDKTVLRLRSQVPVRVENGAVAAISPFAPAIERRLCSRAPPSVNHRRRRSITRSMPLRRR